jgi:hypothetical protein
MTRLKDQLQVALLIPFNRLFSTKQQQLMDDNFLLRAMILSLALSVM